MLLHPKPLAAALVTYPGQRRLWTTPCLHLRRYRRRGTFNANPCERYSVAWRPSLEIWEPEGGQREGMLVTLRVPSLPNSPIGILR